MSSKHYNIAIIGSSLAGRIAAALLAKNGQRVLLLRTHERLTSPWFYSSLFLEQLLGILGGRSCFAAPQPFQVLSSKARISIHGDMSLSEELQREFGEAGSAAQQYLEDLRITGQRIEALLWDNSGLPMPGIKSGAIFRMLCMRHKIRMAELVAPLSETFQAYSPTIRSLLTDLFQGLSLQPISQLSFAHGALLWAHAVRPESIKEPDFSDLLEKRFNQFHGSSESAEDLSSLEFDGQRYTGGAMKAGTRFKADMFLLSTSESTSVFSDKTPIKVSICPSTIGMLTTSLKDQLSPLLENRVIVGGGIPLRLLLKRSAEEVTGHIGFGGTPTEAELRQQLEPVLPFAKYDMIPPDGYVSKEPEVPASCSSDLFQLPLKPGTNLYRLDSQHLLPTLGATGEALLGWTLANHLSKPKPK